MCAGAAVSRIGGAWTEAYFLTGDDVLAQPAVWSLPSVLRGGIGLVVGPVLMAVAAGMLLTGASRRHLR